MISASTQFLIDKIENIQIYLKPRYDKGNLIELRFDQPTNWGHKKID
jgi:hypothetical protein